MYSLFQSSIIQWFMPKEHGASGWRRLLDRSTAGVFKILESLTGARFIEELQQFFWVVSALQKTIQDHSAEIHKLLTSSQSGFVVVTSFDKMKIEEAKTFRRALLSEGYSLKLVITNRAFPLWSQAEDSENSKRGPTEEKLWSYYQNLKQYFATQDSYFADFANQIRTEVQVMRIPDFDQDIYELQNLEMVADEIQRRAR
jgi:anion-transporting  ArsA/GET3 family ATPase